MFRWVSFISSTTQQIHTKVSMILQIPNFTILPATIKRLFSLDTNMNHPFLILLSVKIYISCFKNHNQYIQLF